MPGLILGLHAGEGFTIGDDTEVKVLSNSKGSCRIQIVAPRDKEINRISEGTKEVREVKG